MIRVFYDAGALFIDGREDPMPAGTLVAALAGSTISISTIHGTAPLVACDMSQIADIAGSGFASAAAAMAYLGGQFAMPTVTGVYQDVLTIETQNVIPPLTKPWVSAPGSLANLIFGSETFPNGGGVATFEPGSTTVVFNPLAAGFNLNPTEIIIAQYSIKG